MESTASKAYPASSENAGDGVQKLIAIFRRRLRLFGGVVLSVLAVALVMIISQHPQFTASTTLQLITKKQQIVTTAANQDQAPDSGSVDTEVEVLRSKAIAQRVIRDMRLDQDPDFNAHLRKPSLLETLKSGFSGLAPDSARGQSAAAKSGEQPALVDSVLSGLAVSRAGLTYLINVNYTASTPAKAAAIANGFAKAYLTAQLDAKFSDTSDANDFLNDRLKQLRAQVETADTELQQYKIANNLMSSQGATLTEQEISTLDQQLALTRAQEAEASARLSTAKRQLASGSTGEDVGEALSSPVIQQLRQQRAIASQKVADMQGRYGDRHPEMLKAKRELADLDSQIQGEIQRIISNLEAQAQVARQRTSSIEGSVGQSRGKLAGNNRAIVRLNELQRNADAARTLYETLLNRFKETSVEKGLQQTDARVVSAASTPQSPSTRKGLMAVFATLVALIAGVAAVMLAELLDNGISDGDLIENELDASYLGSIPLLSSSVDSPELARIGPERYVVEKPLSSFAEAIRSLNASVLFSRLGVDIKVVAVSSSLPGEGKTTSSICLTRTLALSGKKVVLVDCDLRQRAVKKILDGEPTVGLLELLNGDAALDDVLLADNKSSAMILPLSNAAYTPKDVFGSEAMTQLLETLRGRFDTVILDTAPVLLVTETRTLAAMADAVVLLVRWRKTSKRAVMASLKLLREAKAPLAGAALTQVDLAQTSSLSALDPAAYYKSYKKYYLE
jgi:exopolysaccharide transport family protein